MEEINNLNETLNGGYAGLYGEIITCDSYGVRQLHFKPQTVWDIGGNIGVFARYARELWPQSKIVCVEPNAENFKYLKKFTTGENFVFINKAIGTGKMWWFPSKVNGAHHVYLNAGVGYPELSKEVDNRMEESDVETILLDELEKEHPIVGGSVIKIDCECGEYAIWNHKPSMDVLRKFDYICGETHPFAATHELVIEAENATIKALMSLSDTHEVRIHKTSFWMTKK